MDEKTIITGVPAPKDMGHTPPFSPEEIVKDYWQWQGYIYVERPPGGGPKVHPTPKRPVQANMIDESRYGRLWELQFRWKRHLEYGYYWGISSRTNLNGRGQEVGIYRLTTIRVLNVWNATLESDGTRQQFTLAVPLRMRTAHEAVAWTFGLSPDAYKPLVEA